MRERFLGNGAFKKLAAREPELSSQLIQAVVSKGGVFLWVFIVVKDLLRGIRNRDTIPDLWRRLNALPREIESLYIRIMSQIDEVHLIWPSKTFQLIQAARQVVIPKEFNLAGQSYLTLAELYFALDDSLNNQMVIQMSRDELNTMCREMEYHITARCACLVEVQRTPGQSKGHVQYFHRTAKDFLEESPRWKDVLDHTKESGFDPWWSMLRSKSLSAHRSLDRATLLDLRVARGPFITMLALAVRIDGTGQSSKKKVLILDDAEVLWERHSLDLIPQCDFKAWNCPLLPYDMTSRSIRSSFFSCALALNFTEYVALRLSQLEARKQKAGRLIATHILRHTIGQADFLALEMDMAITLVQQGAGVNALVFNAPTYDTESRTLWQEILANQIDLIDSNEQKQLHPQLPQFISTALVSGADPSASIPMVSDSLIDYVEAHVRQQYPEEAERLHNVMQSVVPVSQELKTVSPATPPKKRHWWKRL